MKLTHISHPIDESCATISPTGEKCGLETISQKVTATLYFVQVYKRLTKIINKKLKFE